MILGEGHCWHCTWLNDHHAMGPSMRPGRCRFWREKQEGLLRGERFSRVNFSTDAAAAHLPAAGRSADTFKAFSVNISPVQTVKM